MRRILEIIIVIICISQSAISCNNYYTTNSSYPISIDSLQQVDFELFIGKPIVELLDVIPNQYIRRVPITDAPANLFGYTFIYDNKIKLNLYIVQYHHKTWWSDKSDFVLFEGFKLSGYRLYHNDSLLRTSYDDLPSKYADLLRERRELIQIADSILNEGIDLYWLEKAAWIASDTVMSTDKKIDYDSLQGYLSYYEADTVKVIFYNLNNEVLLTYYFKQNEEFKYDISYQKRQPTPIEKEQIYIRKQVYKMIAKDTTFFRKYHGVNFNVTILKKDSLYYSYILSASTSMTDSLILGNDYLLKFTEGGVLLSKEKIHESLMKIKAKADKGGKLLEATMHNHSENYSPFISSTDICTILLYEEFINWKYHLVYSPTYISTFNIRKKVLIIKKVDRESQ